MDLFFAPQQSSKPFFFGVDGKDIKKEMEGERVESLNVIFK